MINKYWNQIKYVLYFGAKYGHGITYINMDIYDTIDGIEMGKWNKGQVYIELVRCCMLWYWEMGKIMDYNNIYLVIFTIIVV